MWSTSFGGLSSILKTPWPLFLFISYLLYISTTTLLPLHIILRTTKAILISGSKYSLFLLSVNSLQSTRLPLPLHSVLYSNATPSQELFRLFNKIALCSILILTAFFFMALFKTHTFLKCQNVSKTQCKF